MCTKSDQKEKICWCCRHCFLENEGSISIVDWDWSKKMRNRRINQLSWTASASSVANENWHWSFLLQQEIRKRNAILQVSVCEIPIPGSILTIGIELLILSVILYHPITLIDGIRTIVLRLKTPLTARNVRVRFQSSEIGHSAANISPTLRCFFGVALPRR